MQRTGSRARGSGERDVVSSPPDRRESSIACQSPERLAQSEAHDRRTCRRGAGWLLMTACLAVMTGCDCTGDASDGGPTDGAVPVDATRLEGLRSLRLEPETATLTVEGATPVTQQYRAFGMFEDG